MDHELTVKEYLREYNKLEKAIEVLNWGLTDKIEYEGLTVTLDPEDGHFIINDGDRDYHTGLIDQTAHTVLGLLGHLRPEARGRVDNDN